MEVDSSVLLFENRMVHEVSNKELPEAIYTTGSVAEVRVKKTPTSVLKLKIQKVIIGNYYLFFSFISPEFLKNIFILLGS